MEKIGNKTYYFTATLAPGEYCRYFNPGELHLGNGYVLDIYFNGMTIWNPRLKANFVNVYPFVRETFETILALFIFREHVVTAQVYKLSLNMQRCIEAMGVRAESNLIWTLDYSGPKKISPPSQKARVNASWRRAAQFFTKINQNINHKLMLKDYMACNNNAGDDAFFFAYRIIEDIREAINSEMGVTNDQCWDKLHTVLHTSKSYLDPLTDVATKVRHGNLGSSIVKTARNSNRRKKILNVAFELMKREFKRKYPGFL